MSARPDARAPMSRAARTARGAAGAGLATLLAAASHGLAGGTVTAFSVVATAVLALPLCVLLGGRIGSLWRLALAVGASQFVYHWSFSGLGLVGSGSSAGSAPAPLHAGHLAAIQSVAPSLRLGSDPTSADAAMWAMHAVAAIATIALLHRGERAFLGLIALTDSLLAALRSVLVPLLLGAGAHRAADRPVSSFLAPAALRERLHSLSAITHRGPPALGA
ncbi:hypothetical protein AB3K78_07745 [Leucobacter sp. HNU]|uniref:hypothetical protein n=1 Tax=Leucobacter sp. HNU TaxID=3236805 RepID=UPI003A802BEB